MYYECYMSSRKLFKTSLLGELIRLFIKLFRRQHFYSLMTSQHTFNNPNTTHIDMPSVNPNNKHTIASKSDALLT